MAATRVPVVSLGREAAEVADVAAVSLMAREPITTGTLMYRFPDDFLVPLSGSVDSAAVSASASSAWRHSSSEDRSALASSAESSDSSGPRAPRPAGAARQQPLALRGQRDHEAAPVGEVTVSLDQAAVEQGGHHVGHALRGDERVPGEVGRGEIGVPLEHGQRGVLQRRQPDRAREVVELGADGQLDLLHQVEQRRLLSAAGAAVSSAASSRPASRQTSSHRRERSGESQDPGGVALEDRRPPVLGRCRGPRSPPSSARG